MQLGSVIAFERVFGHCTLDSDVDLQADPCHMRYTWHCMRQRKEYHHFKSPSDDSTKNIAVFETAAICRQLHKVYQRVVLQHLLGIKPIGAHSVTQVDDGMDAHHYS